MPVDPSIRTDASTFHRPPDGDDDPAPVSVDSEDQLARAHTVIRGSSRAEIKSQPPEQFDRTPAAVAKILTGQRLNHFLLEKMIGGGGMGAVFRARDEQLDRTVAVKVIPFVGDDPDLNRRFRNEAQSAAKLDHPRIARVFEVGSQESWHYIVFEYVRGINIRDKVGRDGVFSIDDAVFATCQLGDAIQHSADRGIVHRDIKPSNVLVGQDDQVKLVDMGLARSEHLELSEDMTASGVTLGTFDYISPEQARDPRDADVRSDIYSLGCTLFFMLTGGPPFPGGTMLQKLLSHGNSPPPDARLQNGEISDDLIAVMRKMLAKSPGDRYQNAHDLIADLHEIATRENLTRSLSIAAPTVSPPNRLLQGLETHAPWMVPAAILLLVAGWLQLQATITRDSFRIPVPVIDPLDELATDAGTSPDTNSPDDRSALTPRSTQAAGEASTNIAAEQQPGQSINQTTGSAAVADNATALAEPGSIAAARAAPGAASDMTSVDQRNDAVTTASGPNSPVTPATTTASSRINESGLPTAANAMAVVRVVGALPTGPPTPDSNDVRLTETLTEALEVARRDQIQRIEIAVPVLRSGPVKIEQDELTIASSVGGSKIVFESGDPIAMQRSLMCSIGSNRIDFRDLHFVWNVPPGEFDGGALFVVNANRGVVMNRCAVTIVNSTRRDEVYAFDVITDPEAAESTSPTTEPASSPDGLPLVAISLNDVIVRGEMSMIHMDYAAGLNLRWDNGLLVVSRRMIDTAGAREPLAEAAGSIELSLERLTAWVPLGLLRMRLGVSGAYPVAIERDAVDTVFVVDEGVPHFEFSGLEELDDEQTLLTLRGKVNAYDASPTTGPVLLLLTDVDGAQRATRLIDVSSDASAPYWWDEQTPRWMVRWTKIELPDVAPSQLMPSDFRQDGIVRGFDEQELPSLPLVPRGNLSG